MTEVQLDLFAARAARDDGIARVDDHADPQWKDEAHEAVICLARTREYFTSDAVWELGLRKPPEARALGPVMMRAARARIIAPTDTFRPSAQTSCHANPARVWRSLIYEASP